MLGMQRSVDLTMTSSPLSSVVPAQGMWFLGFFFLKYCWTQVLSAQLCTKVIWVWAQGFVLQLRLRQDWLCGLGSVGRQLSVLFTCLHSPQDHLTVMLLCSLHWILQLACAFSCCFQWLQQFYSCANSVFFLYGLTESPSPFCFLNVAQAALGFTMKVKITFNLFLYLHGDMKGFVGFLQVLYHRTSPSLKCSHFEVL